MTSIYDIYKIIHNFIVDKLNFDEDKVIINHENASYPDLPFIGLYIDSIDTWTDYNDSMSEDGTEIYTTVQSVPVNIHFYGDISDKAIELQQKLNYSTSRTELDALGLSIIEIGSILNRSGDLQDSEFIEHYVIRCIFETETTTEDTTTDYFEEVEITTEVITDGNTNTSDLPLATLDTIIKTNRS
jgi:hypothetical protein